MAIAIHDLPAIQTLRELGRAAQSAVGRQLALLATTATWLALVIVVITGTKEFNLWSQVTYLHWTTVWLGENLPSLLEEMHPHFLRYLVVYPFFVWGDAAGVSPDTPFSFACLVLLFGVFLAVRRLDEHLSRSPSVWAGVLWSLLLCGLAFVMNGRGILAFSGYALLLVSLVPMFDADRPRWWLFITLPIAVLFCSVSSGVFTVAHLFVWVACIIGVLRYKDVRNPVNVVLLLAASIVTTAVYWNFLVIGIANNLIYFGGGLDGMWEMLTHGAGKVFTVVDPLVLVPAVLVLVIAGLLAIWAARAFNPAVAICGAAGLVAAAGGIFGFTTLSVVFVPALAMMRLLFARPAHIARRSTRSFGQSTAVRP